jgi:hypothetical protein
VPYLQTVSNKAKADTHLSTFGFLPQHKPRDEKPKELKLGQTLEKKERKYKIKNF